MVMQLNTQQRWFTECIKPLPLSHTQTSLYTGHRPPHAPYWGPNHQSWFWKFLSYFSIH